MICHCLNGNDVAVLMGSIMFIGGLILLVMTFRR